MSLLQIKKPTFHIILAFLIIVLLCSNIHVQAENADKIDTAQTLYSEGEEAFNESDYQTALEKFNNSLSIYRERGDQQSKADLLTWMAAVNGRIITGNLVDTMNYLKESKEIYNKLGSKPGEKAAFKNVDKAMKLFSLEAEMQVYRDAKDYELVLKKLNVMLQLVREMRDKRREARILRAIGTVQYGLSNDSEAEHNFNSSVTIFREIEDRQSEADTLTWMAKVNFNTGKFVNAQDYLKDSQEIYKKLNSEPGKYAAFKDLIEARDLQIDILYQIANIQFDLKNYSMAEQNLREALILTKDTDKNDMKGYILSSLAAIYELKNEDFKVLEYSEEALRIFEQIDDKKGKASAFYLIGNFYSKQDKYSKSLQYYNEAFKNFEQIDDKKGMAKSLYSIGGVYYIQGDYSNAQAFREKALVLSQEIKDKETMVAITESLGIVHMEQGSINIALKYYKQALNIIQEIGNHSDEGVILTRIGSLYEKMGNFDKALEVYNEAMQISKERNNTSNQGSVLVDIGRVNIDLANYLEAINNFKEALRVFEEGFKGGYYITRESFKIGVQMDALRGLEKVYSILRDDEKVKEFALKREKIEETYYRKINRYQLYSLLDNGRSLLKEKKFDRALETFRNALDLSKDMDFKNYKLQSLGGIGDTYIELGEYPKALEFHEQALKITREIGDKRNEVKSLFILGEIYYYQYYNQYSQQNESDRIDNIDKSYTFDNAVKYLEMALIEAKDTQYVESIISSQYYLANISLVSGQLQKAKNYFGELINTYESIGEKISVEEYKMSFMEDRLEVYYQMICVLLSLEENEEAFNYVERTKSRILLDLLGNRMKRGKGKDKGLSQREIRLQEKVNELLEKIQKEQSQPEEKQRAIIKEWNKEVERARKEYAELLIKIKQEDPELYSLVSVNPLTLKQIQMLIEPDTTLLEYYFLPSAVFCWIVNDKEYKVFVSEVSELPSKITSFREKIATFQPDYEKEARELYDLLIRPAKPYIKTKRICIVPHSVLHYLPFQALINANGTNEAGNQRHFLIEEYDIFYAPSASVLKFVLEKRKKVSGKVLAFGNPDPGDKSLNLPHAEEEVKRIKESYPETALYLNENATEEKAKRLSGNYDIIHFASHGELNPKSPLFSCIKLAKEKDEDGRLEVHEIFNLNLENASLVTLSACETGLGKLSKGDELIGLTRGFIYAGTPSIVASLWSVNDKSTSDLMSLFYKNLKTHSKVESLRMAQLEMINGEVGKGIVRGVGGITTSKESEDKPQSTMTVNGSHPYFWAPFILLGDWK